MNIMNSLNKILYLGARDDIEPIEDFPNCKEYIYIDTQPRSEADDPNCKTNPYRHSFIQNLLDKFASDGFELITTKTLDENYYKKIMTKKQMKNVIPEYINPTLLIFTNKVTNCQIKYYVSTNIKYNMNEELQNDMKSCDGLIVSGYFPDRILLDYLHKPITLLAYSASGYHYVDELTDNNIVTPNGIQPGEDYFNHGYFIPSHNDECQTYFEIKPKHFSSLYELQDISELWHKMWHEIC